MTNSEDKQIIKRSSQRLKSELRVYYGPTQQTILSGFSVDLSTGGLFLQTEYPFSINDDLILIFSLPGQEKSVSCKARVSWCNEDTEKNKFPSGFGLQFVDLSLADVRAISDFVENYDVEAVW